LSNLELESQSKSPYNRPEHWTNSQTPPFFDTVSFQKRINNVVGLSREGHPIIKLEWAAQVWSPWWGDPDYWVSYTKADGYVFVQRWVFLQRMELGSYRTAWIQTHSDNQPPPPEYYTFFSMAAEHDEEMIEGEPACCWRKWNEKDGQGRRTYLRCWGVGRDPNDSDLDRIKVAVRYRNSQPWHDPNSPLSQEEMWRIRLRGMTVEKQKQLKSYAIMEDIVEHVANSVMGPTGRRKMIAADKPVGGFQQSESGLYVPA